MKFEFVVIYKQDFGAKYACVSVVASDAEKARETALYHYSYKVNEENIVRVVKLGRV